MRIKLHMGLKCRDVDDDYFLLLLFIVVCMYSDSRVRKNWQGGEDMVVMWKL